MSDQAAPQEIVIVRRRGGGEEEGHHGGAWKIAYADFMTAMMAFFLVMWLVNAADKKVLTQVASYFNPLRMSERVSAKKGVEDLVQGSSGETKAEKEGGKKGSGKEANIGKSPSGENAKEALESVDKKSSGQDGQTDFTEQELFNDPYGILEKLATQAVVGRQGGSESNNGTGKTDNGGAAFRDPFDPEFSRSNDQATKREAQSSSKSNQAINTPATDAPNKSGMTGAELPAPSGDVSRAEMLSDATTAARQHELESQKDQKAASQLQDQLFSVLGDLPSGQKPTLSVQSTSEGLLISLTDEFDFEMFRLSSAQPSKQLVVALGRVAGVLKNSPGRIIVRGHTDGRPFVKGTSDNWKLSTQRALMTRYMLISGGLDAKRIERVEGHADEALKVTANPMAAQNRRIELLLRKS